MLFYFNSFFSDLENSFSGSIESGSPAEIKDPKAKSEKGINNSDYNKRSPLKNIGFPPVSTEQAKHLQELTDSSTDILTPKPVELEKENNNVYFQELPSSSSKNYDYQKVASEKLAQAKRKLVITKHISAEDTDICEESFEDFDSDDSVADPDFSQPKENETQVEQSTSNQSEQSDVEPASKKKTAKSKEMAKKSTKKQNTFW